jgi:hypothetical protein
MAQGNIYLIIGHNPSCFLDHGTFIQLIMGDSMLVPQQEFTIYSMWLCGGVGKVQIYTVTFCQNLEFKIICLPNLGFVWDSVGFALDFM